MKITFLNEAGAFGSYKKRNRDSIYNSTRRELTGVALDSIVEARIDELAEVYFNMINEIDEVVNVAFSKFTFKSTRYRSNDNPTDMHILFNYAVSKDFKNDKNAYLNILKHAYCNRFAIEYMAKLNEFYIPIVDTRNGPHTTNFPNALPDNIKEYCDIISNIGAKVEKILKKYEPMIKAIVPSLPSIPTSPKFINIDCDFGMAYLTKLRPLYNAAGITITYYQLTQYRAGSKLESDMFVYPGKMQEAIQEMMKFDTVYVDFHHNDFEFNKKNEKVWNSVPAEIPYLHNKFYIGRIGTSIKNLSEDNFYGLKMLKQLIDTNVFLPDATHLGIDAPSAPITHLKELSVIKKFVDSANITNAGFDFYDRGNMMVYVAALGKKMTPVDAEKEGIDVNSLKRSVYEFDYSNSTAVKTAATTIINNVLKNCSPSTKKDAIDKLTQFIPGLMTKVATAKPHCISSTNKILLCDFHQNDKAGGNFRVEFRTDHIIFSKKGNSVFIYVEMQFKVPVRGVNPKYNKNIGQQTSGKNYEFITGKKIKLEIPL